MLAEEAGDLEFDFLKPALKKLGMKAGKAVQWVRVPSLMT